MSDKSAFKKAEKIDEEKFKDTYFSHEKILKIIDEFISIKDTPIEFTKKYLIDGLGNIALKCTGDPYVVIRMLLMALRTHNNIAFFIDKYYAMNARSVEILNNVLKKYKYPPMAFVYYNATDREIGQHQNYFNKIIYLGEKNDFLDFRRRLDIPNMYAGWGTLQVYIEDESMKELASKIKISAEEQGFDVNFYTRKTIKSEIKLFNKKEIEDNFVILSNDKEIIYTFITKLKAKNIYVNKNPLENYKLAITEDDLVFKKNIIM